MDVTPFAPVLPYVGILLAAIVEGEIAYLAAAALVAHGHLDAAGVLVSGAAGAAIGDQAWFYLFRGRLPRWVARFPALERKAAPLVERVRRHDVLMVLLIRFSPGLRVALAAACAWVDVPAWKLSLLNLVAAFVWAASLLVMVAWVGPAYLAKYGLGGWKGAVLIGVVVFGLFKAFARYEQRMIARSSPR